VRVCKKTLTFQLNLLRKILGVEDYALGVWLATNSEVKALNEKHRGISKATDILSFPLDKVKPGELPRRDLGLARFSKIVTEDAPPTPPHPELGDIVLGMPYVKRYCAKNELLMEQHVPLLLTHGLCHLLGHDHETNSDHAVMQAREDEILVNFWVELALHAERTGKQESVCFPDELPEQQSEVEEIFQLGELELREYEELQAAEKAPQKKQRKPSKKVKSKGN